MLTVVTVNEPLAGAPATWREQAVARFLDAARDLINTSPTGKDFTVQEVVEKSGQSLRSFYQYFGGKQELLLALFEETVRSTAAQLRERIEDEKDPRERLHRFVLEYYALCRPAPRGKGKKKASVALAEFAQQLMTAHPDEATRAFAPLVSLFDEVLSDAVASGDVRADLGRGQIAGVVLEVIMFNAFSTTIGASDHGSGSGDPAEQLWELLLHGIGS